MFCRHFLPRVTAAAARRRRKQVGDKIAPLLIGRCSSSLSDQALAEELKDKDPWLQEQIVAYYRGKDKLAEMMGRDPATFTEKDVDEAIQYLLPSRLSARDARPMMKHPLKIFPKRKVSAFDASGRPLEPAFYTGSPNYYNLIYEIYLCGKKLEKAANEEYWGFKTEKETSLKSTADQKKAEEEELELTEDTLSSVTDQADAIPESNLEEPNMESNAEANKEEVNEEGVKMDGATETDKEKEDEQRAVPMKWVNKAVMANILAEGLSDTQYEELIKRLCQLADHEHSGLISDFLDNYRRPVLAYRTIAKQPTVNAKGFAYAVGKRKTSVAQVWMKRGSGIVTVNKKSLNEYFRLTEQRSQVLYPLVLLDCLDQYDVNAKVSGGGLTGQGGAIRLGISKALLAFLGSDDGSDILEKEGLLIRDPRMVERKKPGQKKARKKFAWVKR